VVALYRLLQQSEDHGNDGSLALPRRGVSPVLGELPFRKGKSLQDMGGVVDQVVGGWQLGDILAWRAVSLFTMDANTRVTRAQSTGQL
jgi:hypothetical protein